MKHSLNAAARAKRWLRIYSWRRPTLSFGRNQRALHRYDAFALQSWGVDAVRRPTGGREVLHDRELTYAIVAPTRWSEDGLTSPRALYRAINEALVSGLRTLGVSAHLAGSHHRALHPDAGACFGAPAPDEIEAQGGKLVGSAQRRYGATLLQHGSILIDAPGVSLDALRPPPSEAKREPTPVSRQDSAGPGVTLRTLLGRPVAFGEVARAIETALAGSFGGTWRRGELRDDEADDAQARLNGYRNPLVEVQ
jgi:lipoyl(octanoyl) transferase